MVDLTETLPKTTEVLADGIQRGYHFGGQVAIYRNGDLVVDEAFGTLGPDSGEPMTTDKILCWRSAGKPWTAVALLRVGQDCNLPLTDTIEYTINEFASQPLMANVSPDSAIHECKPTLKGLLTHNTGLLFGDSRWPDVSFEKSVANAMYATVREPDKSGSVAAYDPQSAWFILGHVLESSKEMTPVAKIVDDLVFEPAGVDATLSMSDAEVANKRRLLAPQFNTARGASDELPLHTLPALQNASPGSSCRGATNQLAKLYATLLSDARSTGGDHVLLAPSTIELMTRRHREGLLDLTFQHKLDFGLGVIVNSNRYGAETVPYGFGRHASDDAFGHGGAQCAMGFADPAHDLAVAWVLNGLPGEPRHNKRNREINSAIYEDLGLV